MQYLMTGLKAAAVALALFWLLLRWFESASVYHPNPMAGPDPGAYGMAFEPVALEGLDGVRLRAWFIRGSGPVTVLYSGGNGESAAAILASAHWRRMIADLGVSILVWDYPGYGASGGRPSEQGLYAGARAALQYLRGRPDVDPSRILLWGHSLGSAVAAEVAAGEQVAGLILQAPLASVLEMGRDLLGPLWHVARRMPALPAQRYESLAKLSRVRAPVLILHGTADEVIPVRHGRLLGQAGAELVEVESARHMSPWDGLGYGRYYEAVAPFVRRAGLGAP